MHHTTDRCKHIAGVEHLLFISSETSLGKSSIKERKIECPRCKKESAPENRWSPMSTKMCKVSHMDGDSGTIWALNTVSVYRSGPDAVGQGILVANSPA